MNQQHRILVIGGGSIGERHVRCGQKTGRAEIGLCESNQTRCDEIAQRYALKHSYTSLDDALKQSWDAAIIATPATSHIPIASRLAERNIHLFIEKPLAIDEDGLDALVEKINANQLKCMVAYVYRAHPALTAMRNALASGKFGRPIQIITACGQHFPFYRPAYRDTYFTQRHTGGGAIQDSLTHLFNACEWLVGPISRICVDGEHRVLDGIDVEDTVNAMARHESCDKNPDKSSSVMASYTLNQHQYPNEVTITVIAERGALRLELHNKRWLWIDTISGEWQPEPVDMTDRDNWFLVQANAFFDYLEGSAEPLCTLHEARQSLRVNMASLQSMDNASQWQTIDISNNPD